MKVSHYLYKKGFAYALGIRVDDKIERLVSSLPDTVKQGVLRPGTAAGVADTDADYVAGITELIANSNRMEYAISLDTPPGGTDHLTDRVPRRRTPAMHHRHRRTPGEKSLWHVVPVSRRCRIYTTAGAAGIKDAKDVGFLVVSHHCFAANRVRMQPGDVHGKAVEMGQASRLRPESPDSGEDDCPSGMLRNSDASKSAQVKATGEAAEA